jgi:hypothetical protein
MLNLLKRTMTYPGLEPETFGLSVSIANYYTIFNFWAAYRSENLPLKYEQLVLLSFGQHPRLKAVEQNWVDQGLMNGEFGLA